MQQKPQYVRISSEELLQIMQAKTDEDLYLLLRVYSKDYTPEAIKAANEEFSHRKLDEPTMSRIMAAADKPLEETKVICDTEVITGQCQVLGWDQERLLARRRLDSSVARSIQRSISIFMTS